MNKVYRTDELEMLRHYVGEGIYKWQQRSSHLCVPLDSRAYLLVFNWCDVKDMAKKEERVVIFCSEKDFLLFSDHLKFPAQNDDDGETAPFRVLSDFLDMLTAEDVDVLDQLEDELNAFEEKLITLKLQQETGTDIAVFRRSLLRMKRYYEQLSDIADGLALNEAGAVPQNLSSRFLALSHRINHLEDSVAHLREYVTQVREAYQAQIDIEQNQIMKIFTVLTAIFLPLSLIVGWYGMNFQMPEYEWRFGYVFVIIFSIVVCGFMYWFIKRKKWF